MARSTSHIALVLAILISGHVSRVSAATYSLELTSKKVPSTAGSDTVALDVAPTGSAWSAAAVDSWLHVDPGSASGSDNAIILFTYDANPNAVDRVGTLQIQGNTFTVTQSGTAFAPQSVVVKLATLSGPWPVATDAMGNIFVADSTTNQVARFDATTQVMTTLISSGLSNPRAIAVDQAGNIYIADHGSNSILKWTAATAQLSTLISATGSSEGLSVDMAGNIFYTDFDNLKIIKWTAATQLKSTLVSGLHDPSGIVLDSSGNLYYLQVSEGALFMWTAATQQISTLVPAGLGNPLGLARDGSGNIFIAGQTTSSIFKWSAATQTLSTIVGSGLQQPFGVAVDSAGNLYITDGGDRTVKKSISFFAPLGTVITPGNPPVIDAIAISRTPARTATDVTFSALARSTSGIPIMSYNWLFYLNNSGVPDGAPLTVNPVTRQFSTAGTYTVAVVAFDGVARSAIAQTFTITLDPNAGSSALNIIEAGQAVVNPANALGFSVARADTANVSGSLGGVVNLDVLPNGVNGGSVAGESYVFSTNGQTLSANPAMAVKFTRPGVYSIDLTATLNTAQRKTRLMLPISGPETGSPLSGTDNRTNHGPLTPKVSGRFTSKNQAVSVAFALELPGGLDLASLGGIDLGISNVIVHVTPNSKGKVTANSNSAQVKKVAIKFPKLATRTLTKGGELLAFTVTLQGKKGALLTDAGFAEDGVVQMPTSKITTPLSLQFAAQLAGVTYHGFLNVAYKPGKDLGSIKTGQ